MSTRRWWLSAVFLTRRLLVLGVVVLVSGCASAFRQGEQSARAGDWDTAIAYYERALQDDPDRPDYRITLERATLAASRAHIDLGRAFEERQELGSAVREYRLAAEFDPSNSEVSGTSLPTFGSRKVVTRLRLRDGESNLLAGLLREEDRRTLRGLPGALRVPLLQSLFGDNDEAIRKTEVVMLLTPRIVRTHELTRSDVSPIHIGTQTNLGLSGPPPLIAPQPDAGAPPLPLALPDVEEAPAIGLPTAGLPAVPELPSPTTPTLEPAEIDPDLSTDPVVPLAATPVQPDLVVPPPPAQSDSVAPAPEPLPAARVLVTPPGSQFRLGGGPYTVPVSISDASRLSTVSLTVGFDPAVLSVRTVQEGSFMRQGGSQVTFTQQVDAEAGLIQITSTRNGDTTGAAGAGLLAAVLLDTVGPGSVTLNVSGTAMTPEGVLLDLEFSTSTVTVQ